MGRHKLQPFIKKIHLLVIDAICDQLFALQNKIRLFRRIFDNLDTLLHSSTQKKNLAGIVADIHGATKRIISERFCKHRQARAAFVKGIRGGYRIVAYDFQNDLRRSNGRLDRHADAIGNIFHRNLRCFHHVGPCVIKLPTYQDASKKKHTTADRDRNQNLQRDCISK